MIVKNDAIELDTTGLESLIKAFKKIPHARVGVLGSSRKRQGENSNASIGRKHEFGLGVPKRSWLRVPLIDNLQKYLEKNGAFNSDAQRSVIKERSMRPWISALGATGVQIVLDGFNSGGFGKWAPSNMKYKKNKQTLVETQQLRNSIIFDVKD